jgi:hypothetical protein
MICPRYMLMDGRRDRRTSYGQDLFAYIDDMVQWIASVEFVNQIKERCLNLEALLQIDQLDLVSGESAGGHLAIYCWLSRQTSIKIKAIYLQYPMLASYKRQPGHEYMGQLQSFHNTRLHALTLLIDIFTRGPVLGRVGAQPPNGMGAAYLLSSVCIMTVVNDGKPKLVSAWQLLFQEVDVLQRIRAILGKQDLEKLTHSPTVESIVIDVQELVSKLNDPNAMLRNFGLEYLPDTRGGALGYKQTKPPTDVPKYLPKLVAIHRDQDMNCSAQSTVELVKDLKKLYGPEHINLFIASGEKHAFAYHRTDPWMKKVTLTVKQHMQK